MYRALLPCSVITCRHISFYQASYEWPDQEYLVTGVLQTTGPVLPDSIMAEEADCTTFLKQTRFYKPQKSVPRGILFK